MLTSILWDFFPFTNVCVCSWVHSRFCSLEVDAKLEITIPQWNVFMELTRDEKQSKAQERMKWYIAILKSLQRIIKVMHFDAL